ncbi:MAG: alcohol dehydrogenase catalytic domain-containing protein, partial [Pseudomonadota bacterium]
MTEGIPETMSACVLHGMEDVRLERIPVPKPRKGEILVRVEAALTCGTDLKVFLRGYHERMIRPPSVFGHEFAGRVVLSENDRFPEGTRVVAANSAPCGRCLFCDAGQPNLCRDLLFLNGAYAEYVLIPSRIADINCLPIPPDLPIYRAALVEPLACTVKGVEAVALKKGEKVLIIGAGPVGLMLARLSVLAGAEVTIVDDRPDRLAVA